MVGHTGNLDATITAMEAVDLGLARLIKAIDKSGAILVVTADHGNADEMLEKNKKGVIAVRTAHSLNNVPFIVYNADVKIKEGDNYGLANVAATVADLLGLTPDEHWECSLIEK